MLAMSQNRAEQSRDVLFLSRLCRPIILNREDQKIDINADWQASGKGNNLSIQLDSPCTPARPGFDLIDFTRSSTKKVDRLIL